MWRVNICAPANAIRAPTRTTRTLMMTPRRLVRRPAAADLTDVALLGGSAGAAGTVGGVAG